MVGLMEIDSSVWFTNWTEAIESIPDEKEQLKAYKAIHKYQAYHEEPELEDGYAKVIFNMAKPTINDLFTRRMASIENGRKGGRPKTAQSDEESEDTAENSSQNKPNHNLKKPNHNLEKPSNNLDKNLEKPNQNLYVNENVNVNVNENVNNKSRFVKPNVEEVREYCISRNNSVDPEEFVDFYSSKNLMVG